MTNTNIYNTNIFIGLIKGRHALPVEEYIFGGEINPVDFDEIWRIVSMRLSYLVQPKRRFGQGLNQDDATDVSVIESDVHLNVYVTGLTAATAAVIRYCAYNGVSLTLWHYNRESGEYAPQRIF